MKVLACLFLLLVCRIGLCMRITCNAVDLFMLEMLYVPSVAEVVSLPREKIRHLSNSFVPHALIALSSGLQAQIECPTDCSGYQGHVWEKTYKRYIDTFWPEFDGFATRKEIWEDFGTCWLEWTRHCRKDDLGEIFTGPGVQETYFERGINITKELDPFSAIAAPGSPLHLNEDNEAVVLNTVFSKHWKGVTNYHLYCRRYADRDMLIRIRVCLDSSYKLIDCPENLAQKSSTRCPDTIFLPTLIE
eukprot:TRINITY_DN545_c0_g3_i1.p1 TRINITY_DN545_c0_g3~~TRINITY_DN545_c0_g3_i1.p1  ORF type:complete len:246 (-),score=13.40 TRINITY_DN545_c0_g3_i1:98-835(-)